MGYCGNACESRVVGSVVIIVVHVSSYFFHVAPQRASVVVGAQQLLEDLVQLGDVDAHAVVQKPDARNQSPALVLKYYLGLGLFSVHAYIVPPTMKDGWFGSTWKPGRTGSQRYLGPPVAGGPRFVPQRFLPSNTADALLLHRGHVVVLHWTPSIRSGDALRAYASCSAFLRASASRTALRRSSGGGGIRPHRMLPSIHISLFWLLHSLHVVSAKHSSASKSGGASVFASLAAATASCISRCVGLPQRLLPSGGGRVWLTPLWHFGHVFWSHSAPSIRSSPNAFLSETAFAIVVHVSSYFFHVAPQRVSGRRRAAAPRKSRTTRRRRCPCGRAEARRTSPRCRRATPPPRRRRPAAAA